MKTQIVTIGNSQGVRIPKILLEQSKLGKDVELEVCDDGILIRHGRRIRAGWEESFRAFAETGDDFEGETIGTSSFEEKEWRW